MNPQEYFLNIRPGDGYPQTVKVSQGDVGRPLLFHLMDGVNPLSIPAGATITIHGTKPSGLGFTETCTVSGSSAAISTTLDITQEYGLFPAELVVSANDDIIATANISLYVERSPHPDGTTDGTKEELDDLYTEVNQLKEEISELGGGLSDDLKAALLQLASKVAYIDDDGADYYQDLYDALYPSYTVTNTLTGCTTSNAAASAIEGSAYSATITASSGYMLTGATVSITMGGTDITSTAYNNGTISIVSVTGNLIITVTAVAVTLSSISAVYTQSGTVYTSDSLDSLKTDLVVTATWSDTSTSTVASADYTLSGTLTVGTSTITVTYSGKTTTFTVNVTEETPLYQLEPVAETSMMNVSASLQNVDALSFNKTSGNGSIVYFNNDGTIALSNSQATWFSLSAGDEWKIQLIDISYNNSTAGNKFNIALRNNSNSEIIKSGDVSIASTGTGTLQDIEVTGTVASNTGNLTLSAYIHRAMQISFKVRFYVNGVWYV